MHRPSSTRAGQHSSQGGILQEEMVPESGSDVRHHANDQGVTKVPMCIDECMEQVIVVRHHVRQRE